MTPQELTWLRSAFTRVLTQEATASEVDEVYFFLEDCYAKAKQDAARQEQA